MRILDSVVRMNHSLAGSEDHHEPSMLNRALERARHLAKHDYLVVIVSDAALPT